VHITYVKYAGKKVDPDRVNWYDKSIDVLIDNYFNTGDICVYESTLRLLEPPTGEFYLNIDEPVNPDVVSRLKALGSTLVLRGSNYLHEQMNWGYFDDWLKALDLPVVACGMGAQAETDRPIEFSPQSRYVWKHIADHCQTIGVRGAFSAETLKHNGVGNIEIVGCPSLFRARNRDLALEPAPGGPRRVSFSVRREVDVTYASDPVEFVETQKRIIAKLDLVADLYLSCHGEPEEKAFFYRAPRAREEATARLVASGWFDHASGGVLKRLYESKLYYFSRPSDYDYYAPQFDAALGYRVHAVLPAAALGVPAAMFDYDTRSRELAETFDLPLYKPDEFERMTLAEAFAPERFDKFNSRFKERYDRMKHFFVKNGVSTRM